MGVGWEWFVAQSLESSRECDAGHILEEDGLLCKAYPPRWSALVNPTRDVSVNPEPLATKSLSSPLTDVHFKI